jgi:uncharacterized delta-60 repeat protein
MSTVRSSRLEWCVEDLEHRWLLAVFGPDVSFGEGGTVAVPAGSVIAPLPDGKVFAVGRRFIPGWGFEAEGTGLLIVSRLNPDGALDASFGDGGQIKLTRTSTGQFSPNSVERFTGSRLWVLEPHTQNQHDLSQIRAYTPELVLDTSFSGDGLLVLPTQLNFNEQSDTADGDILGLTSDGGLVLFIDQMDFLPEGSGLPIERNDLVKVKADGSIDTSFGNGGFVTDVLPVHQLRWTAHGLIAFEGSNMTRYLIDGVTPDPSFGTNGTVVLPSTFSGFAEQPDGKLLVTSREGPSSETTRLQRYNVDGSPDTTFGAGGGVVLPGRSDVRIVFDEQHGILATGHPDWVRRFTVDGDPLPELSEVELDLPNGLLAFDASGRLLTGGLGLSRFAERDPLELGRDGIVSIIGSDDADAVMVDAGPAAGTIRVTLNGDVTDFDAADVRGFNFALRDGDNSVAARSTLPVTVVAGDGNDTVVTGGGDDSIVAGLGDNDINVGNGNDFISAGDSDVDNVNKIAGGNGDKQIVVRSGTSKSTINLRVGNSNVDCGPGDITIDGGSNTVQVRGGSLTILGSGNNTISAGGTDLTVTTGEGNDTVRLGLFDVVRTNGGNDVVEFADAGGTVFLGDGHDRAVWTRSANPRAYTVFGGLGNDYIDGGSFTSSFDQTFGNQAFFGEAGKDTLIGGVGVDLLNGGTGNDQLFGGAGADRLYGWSGDDTIEAGAGNDQLTGQDGADNLYGGSGDDELFGGAGRDRLYSESGQDQLFGEGGDDRLYADYAAGAAGAATLHGGGGDDQLVTDDGLSDQLFGDDGTDSALADGADELDGVESSASAPAPPDAELPQLTLAGGVLTFNGTDAAEAVSLRVEDRRILATVGAETRAFDVGRVVRIQLEGAGGDDTLALDASVRVPASLNGGMGNDRLAGGSGDDMLNGFVGSTFSDGDDTLHGGAGDDTLDGGLGTDVVDGGAGVNTADYHAHFNRVIIDLEGGTDPGNPNGDRDIFSNITAVIGGQDNDFIAGTDADDTLIGGADEAFHAPEADTLLGRGGNDVLRAGGGEDYVEGGAGDDHIDGGRDFDRLFGLAGNDRILSTNDAVEDIVRGGDGDDSADTDTLDDVIGVERVE